VLIVSGGTPGVDHWKKLTSGFGQRSKLQAQVAAKPSVSNSHVSDTVVWYSSPLSHDDRHFIQVSCSLQRRFEINMVPFLRFSFLLYPLSI